MDAIGYYSQIARDFDAKYASSPAFRERLELWNSLIAHYSHPEGDVLDAGCGSGVFSVLAARRARSVMGFDASPKMLELAEARQQRDRLDNATFHVAAFEDANILQGRSFDLILCSSVLEYLEDCWRAFDWLATTLKPNGVIVFSMPNGASLYRKTEKLAYRVTGRPAYYGHVRNVPKADEVRVGLHARGFDVLSIHYYAATPALSRLARAIGRPDLADNLFATVCKRCSQRC